MSFKIRSFLMLSLLLCTGILVEAQTTADDKKQEQQLQVKNLINSRKYKFHALSATSQRGKTIQLNTEYFLKVNNDTLNVDLPYYGRAYTTSYPPTDLSVRFTSTQFSYASDSAKKGSWEITIQPKNENNASKIFMSVSANGYCTVRINSNTRQTISYYGTLEDY